MKDRLMTLLGACVAFYLLFRLLFPQVNFTEKNISFPTTEDRGKYGLAGLQQWLQRAKVPVYSLRERYQTLISHAGLSDTGNLLIVSLPQRLDARHDELEQLATWVETGNHVLLLVAMSDWPQWADRRNAGSVDRMLSTFNLEMTGQDSEQDDDAEEDKKPTAKEKREQLERLLHPKELARHLIPGLTHPLTANIHSLQATWLESEGINWAVSGVSEQRSLLVLFKDREDQQPALWLAAAGAGYAIITRHADLLSNVSLGRADNARLLENMIMQLVAADGHVIFDDMHQGLSAIYEPDAFFHDPRLLHTLFFMLALWIVYIMGHTNRFAPVKEKRQRLNLRDHIMGIGNLFARRLHTSAVAMRHVQHFFNEVRSCYGLPQNSQPVWELLRTNAAIDARDLKAVMRSVARAEQHRHINLVRLTNKLNSLRRKMR